MPTTIPIDNMQSPEEAKKTRNRLIALLAELENKQKQLLRAHVQKSSLEDK